MGQGCKREAMAITYLEAIREAQAKALEENDSVYIYGQDVAEFGGAFKATRNLAERFPGRVIDSPISEDAMIGSAVGAAIEGMRPIIEMQFADFSSIAFNQIVNQAATLYYRTSSCARRWWPAMFGVLPSGDIGILCLIPLATRLPG